MMQDKAGRRASSTVFKEDRFFDLMVVSFENASSHMLCKRARVCQGPGQKGLGIHFLSLSKNHIKSVLKIEISNFCRLINMQTLPGLLMTGV